jgi:hypothetical protein
MNANSELAKGNLNRFQLKLFTPNAGLRIDLVDTPVLILDEKAFVDLPGDVTLGHFFVNYYFLRKLGEKNWNFVGESNESENSWEIKVETKNIFGTGIYAAKGLMFGSYQGKSYFAEDEIRFSVFDSSKGSKISD